MVSTLDDAKELYLRGFNGSYIKAQTSISIQSMLKQLKTLGEVYTKDDIVQHQIDYLKENYTKADVIEAYAYIASNFDDLEKASRGKHINVLGCGFGNYKKVFVAILGKDEYMALRNKFWKAKQKATMLDIYGVDNVFRPETYSSFVSAEAVAEGRVKRTNTMLERYGVEHPNANRAIAEKMVRSAIKTNNERYGVSNAMQVKSIAERANKKRQETMLSKYGFKNSVEVESIRNTIFDNRRKNNTLNTSKPEDILNDILVNKYGKDDVRRNVIVDSRYPFHVDFYIKSLDLFVELNGDRCHNDHWFDEADPSDIATLNRWKNSQIRIEAESNKKSRYRQFIKTWTKSDVTKRNKAKSEKLNYLVFWDGSCRIKNGKREPKLADVYEWINAGCPMPDQWHKHNTY